MQPVTLNAADVSQWVGRLWWPALRVGGFVLAAPIASEGGHTAAGQDRHVGGAGIPAGAAGADPGGSVDLFGRGTAGRRAQELLIGVAIGMVVHS